MCGAQSDDEAEVHPAMWPVRGRGWSSGSRCFDRDGCRARVEAKGLAWPVDDGTPDSPATTDVPDLTNHAVPVLPADDPRDEPDWSF